MGMTDMGDVRTAVPEVVPHFPRISAADRADGSVDVLVQGESRVFESGEDAARLKALRFLAAIAADLGRGVRVTTWTLDRVRASIVVLPTHECYDEADPAVVVPIEVLAAAGASAIARVPATAVAPVAPVVPPARVTPSPDIPAAVRGLDRAPVKAAPSKRRRTGTIVAAVLAMLLLWSGIVAALLTTGHHAPAIASSQLAAPPAPATDTDPAPAPAPSAAPSPAVDPVVVVKPVVDAVGGAPGALTITVSGTGASKAHPTTVHFRVDPATGATIRQSLRIEADHATLTLDKLAGGAATWVVLVPGAHLVKGQTTVASPPVKHHPNPGGGLGGGVSTGTTPTTPTTPVTPTTPTTPTPAHHHHHSGSSSSGGHTQPAHPSGGSQPTHHHPHSNPPPPHPHAD